MRDPCPFCDTDIAAISFMQSTNFRVICNHAPILPGHSLVVPKQHCESILQLDDAALAEFIQLARDASARVKDEFKADGFDWTIQEGAAAGQTVAHLHLHIIPRHHGDLPAPGDWYPKLMAQNDEEEGRPKFDHQSLVKIADRLRLG